MHSLCCWPPERLRPLASSLSLTSSHSAARFSESCDAGVELGLGELVVEAHAEGDIVVDGHGERRRLLEHHAHLGAKQIEILLGAQDVLAVEHHLALGPLIGIKVVDAVQDAQQRGLAAARRPDKGRHLVLQQIDVDVRQGAVSPVIEIQPLDRDLLFHRGHLGWCLGRLFHVGMNCKTHSCTFLAERALAKMLKPNTVTVIRRAPVQASCCQSS